MAENSKIQATPEAVGTPDKSKNTLGIVLIVIGIAAAWPTWGMSLAIIAVGIYLYSRPAPQPVRCSHCKNSLVSPYVKICPSCGADFSWLGWDDRFERP
jgi:hypothetical protein